MKIIGKGEFNMVRVFEESVHDAFVKSVEFAFAKIFEYAPVGRTKTGPVNLRNALQYDFDWAKMEAYIGIPKGSEVEKIAMWTEFGTGERGSKGWQKFYSEEKPIFTIPIVPIRAKAMHFIDIEGKDVFMKKSRGQKPQAWARRGLKDSEPYIEKIWKDEFSDVKIRRRMEMKKKP